ncbi:hypothetical protein BDR22DRAFT_901252, partial [Usnea florida]
MMSLLLFQPSPSFIVCLLYAAVVARSVLDLLPLQGGVTVDLSSFTYVSVSADRKTTAAGGRTRWSSIYSKLDPIDLSIKGGRVFAVRIGG